MLNKKDNYFNYKKYPEEVRKYIYTTNVVENINSRIELIRANTGGYFQSMKKAEVAIYVTVSRIKKNNLLTSVNTSSSNVMSALISISPVV